MHHLARRTSLVGRQPEALRRSEGRKDGGRGGGVKRREKTRGATGAEQQMGIEWKVKRE